MELNLSCDCGQIAGVIEPRDDDPLRRVICYCDDCRRFARHLDHGDWLDAHGGSDIVQVSPAAIRFTAGTEHIGCLRLSPKGMFRWYATCCNTPIANTMATSKMPFSGLQTACLKPKDALEPPRSRIFGEFAEGDRAALNAIDPPVNDRIPLSILAATLLLVFKRFLRGEHRCSPFFRQSDGAPIVTPKVIDAA